MNRGSALYIKKVKSKAQTDWLGFCKAWGHIYSVTPWWNRCGKRAKKLSVPLCVAA